MNTVVDRLTVIIAILAGVASVGGLTVPGLYRDAELFKCAWLANDAVTTILAPALLLVHHRYKRGSVCRWFRVSAAALERTSITYGIKILKG